MKLSRQEKQDMIWSKVIEDDSIGPIDLSGATLLSLNYKEIFDIRGDELVCEGSDECRIKGAHPIGAVAKGEWISEGYHPYTGMFKGADTTIMRLSTAVTTDQYLPSSVPSVAVKMLRDKMESGNFLTRITSAGINDLT